MKLLTQLQRPFRRWSKKNEQTTNLDTTAAAAAAETMRNQEPIRSRQKIWLKKTSEGTTPRSIDPDQLTGSTLPAADEVAGGDVWKIFLLSIPVLRSMFQPIWELFLAILLQSVKQPAVIVFLLAPIGLAVVHSIFGGLVTFFTLIVLVFLSFGFLMKDNNGVIKKYHIDSN